MQSGYWRGNSEFSIFTTFRCQSVTSLTRAWSVWLLGVALVLLTALVGCARQPSPSAQSMVAPQRPSVQFSHVYHLRVYGTLVAQQLTPQAQYGVPYQQLQITAADHAKAEIVVSKMLRDFTTLPTVKAHMVMAGHATIPALCFNGGRRLLPVLRPNQNVIEVYGFATPVDMAAFLKAAPHRFKGAENLLSRHYPLYMDFWDRHCMGSWYSVLTGHHPHDNANFTFMKHYGMSVNTSGAISTIAERAYRYGIGYLTNRWMSVSDWTLNADPAALTQGDPDMSYESNYYGNVPFAENPLQDLQTVEMVNFYKHLPALNHLVTLTEPYGETGPQDWDIAGMTQRDRYSLRDFVHYLRDIRKLSLKRLGQRWYGNANRYKSWDAVTFPRERDFYGWKNGQSQELSGTWRTLPIDYATGVTQSVYKVQYVDRKWLTFHQPGTQYITAALSTVHRPAGGWMRFSFNASPALLHAGKPVYLTICPLDYSVMADPDVVYLNGKKIGDIVSHHNFEWAQFDVSHTLHPGVNLLAVYGWVGCIRGPTFLTLKKMPVSFPSSNARLNARLYDLRQWVANCIARANARAIEHMRNVAPYQPIKVMSFDAMADVMMPYLKKYGGCPHCTGEGGWFRPWFKRLGYLYGVPDSSEPGGPADTLLELRQLFFVMTYEGMNAHEYFGDLRDILRHPDQKAYYQRNLGYFKLMGRFDLRKPDIAIAYSLRVDRAHRGLSNQGLENDLGRGDIQQAHFGFVYCSEQAIRQGLVNHDKIILDDNFNTLHPSDIVRLKAWVKAGGTLVLNSRSGRNTYRQADAWPIDAITGCTAMIRPQVGTVTFVKHPAILQNYAGRMFTNYGASVDWQKRNYFKDCIALTPQDKGVDVIARYQDGMAAIVMRKLGNGRVVVLGSNFYRHAHDTMKGFWTGSVSETAFYQSLFESLGVAPLIHSAQQRLYAERFIANSGSTQMLVLGDQSHTRPLQNASAVWHLSFVPQRVFDPVTGKTLPVKIQGQNVVIRGLNLKPFQMRYYAVELTDWSAGQVLKHWLWRQSQLWHSIPPALALPKLRFPMPLVRLLGNFDVKQFDNQAAAERAAEVNYKPGNGWRVMPRSDWLSAGLQTGVNVWGVYRKTFTLSKAWLTGLRGVEPVWSAPPLYNVPDQIAVNGVTIVKNDGVVISRRAFLALLKPGKNLFTFVCHGRNGDGDGGFTGILAMGRIPAGKIVNESTDWTIYRTVTRRMRVSFPASGTWIMARKSMVIPKRYSKDNVWIEVKSMNPGSASLVSTNGVLRYPMNTYGGSRFAPHPLLVNITPDVHFGRPNDVIIGGSNLEVLQPSSGDFHSVRLIFVKPVH